MSTCFKTFQEIKISHYRDNLLRNANNYLAHTHNWKRPEEFYEHNNLVIDYFLHIVKIHALDKVTDELISEIFSSRLDDKVAEFVKMLFFNSIAYHDYGKVNENFQLIKMKNQNPFFKVRINGICDKHSILSAYIFLVHHFFILRNFRFNREQKLLLNGLIFLFSYPIIKHHSPILNEYKTDIEFDEEIQNYLKEYLLLFDFADCSNVSDYPAYIDPSGQKLKDKYIESLLVRLKEKCFPLFALIKLNYSLLTASDYLATAHYMNNWNEMPANFGTLTKERIDEIFKNVSEREWFDEQKTKFNYNRNTYANLDVKQDIPLLKSGKNLNVIRQIMAAEVIRNIRESIDKNLFYIEAPTGGGKTNLSLLATMELLKHSDGKLNKVFYIFPFTTLITQTYKSLKETLGLNENELIELHSKAGFKTFEKREDDQYGSEKKNYIDFLFANYPFCLMTHIKFFDILKTNEKETNYLLHRLANSVVVIDELQSYSPQHWDKIIYFIRQYAKAFNIKFILMSATLPKLDKLNVIKNQVDEFVYLLPNAKKDYFNNVNFRGRVDFNFDLLKEEDIQLNDIADTLLEKSKEYTKCKFEDAKPEGSVYTIIEFIFKKTASEFHTIISEKEKFFDEVFLLSGTILEHRRRQIISYLKDKNNRKKKILLITTQVVEAGVDIDMDLGFKDTSLIDSDEQLAGRINRNVNKENCQLFLFNYNKEAVIYGADKRLEFSKPKYLSTEKRQQILQEKDFDLLYNLVMNERNEWNSKEMVQNFSDYQSHIQQLRFRSVHDEFKLIDQENISCFIPIEVPVKVENECVFSENDLSFLAQNDIFPNSNNCIEGADVFNLYINLIQYKVDFTEQKIKEKTLQGIMSKYTFSLFVTRRISETIDIYIGEPEKSEYGYKYIRDWESFYSIEGGMNDVKFNSNETQFL